MRLVIDKPNSKMWGSLASLVAGYIIGYLVIYPTFVKPKLDK